MPFNLITNLDPLQQVDITERGFHYGDGLFETMLLNEGTIRYWHEHFQRLYASAARLHIKCPQQSWFDHHLQPFLQIQTPHIIKIILTRGSGGRGISVPEDLIPNVYIVKYKHEIGKLKQQVKATFSEIALPINLNLAGLKHLNRLDYVLASRALNQHSEYDEALLADCDGNIIEGIVHNLFFIHQKDIFTPDLTQSGVDGIMRQLILKKLKQEGKKVRIGHYSKADVLSADEVFLCNSVQGIRPVIRLQRQDYDIGPITQQLQQDYS